MPNASWRRWGVATARGGVSPTLEAQRKGREGCTSGARKPGEAPCGREGETPLSCFCFCCCCCTSGNQGGALRGRNGTAEEGGGGLQSRPQTGRILPPDKKRHFVNPKASYGGSSTGLNCDDEESEWKAKLRLSGRAKGKEGASIEMYTAVL